MVRLQSNLWPSVALLLISVPFAATAQQSHFLADDPLLTVPEMSVAATPHEQNIDELYDFAYNSIKYKRPVPSPSLGINTLGEVPDSGWYTNRHAAHALSKDALKQGPRTTGTPVPPFTVVSAKTEGVTPGFRIRDQKDHLYFIKVDPRSNPEMSSAADVIGSLFFYALGYNVPENYILVARREDFHLSPKATITGVSGKKRTMHQGELDDVLNMVPRTADGSIRLLASLAVSGKLIGPFLYDGTRGDDPNDLIPHQQRRDLRGLAVFCAWLNHTDAKAQNSMDSVQSIDQHTVVKHYLIDFGASLGSDSDIAKDPRHGREFFVPEPSQLGRRAGTFGLHFADWETVKYPRYLKAAGNITVQAFDPLLWRSNYPNSAFQAMLPADAYWAASKIMAFSDEDIRAIVEEGRYTDPRVTEYLTKTLIARRDAIGRTYLLNSLPLENLRIESDQIAFTNIAASHHLAPETAYSYRWFKWNNHANQKADESNGTAQIPNSLSTVVEGNYIGCIIADSKNQVQTVTTYFKRTGEGWRLVGVERTPPVVALK